MRQIVNEGKTVDDIPRLAKGLKAVRGMSVAAKAAMAGRIASKVGVVLTLLAIAGSAQQAVAGEGPYAERLKDEALAVKILNQIGYDTVFGEQVEKYVFPTITGFFDRIYESLGVGPSPENRNGMRRNGILITPNTDLK